MQNKDKIGEMVYFKTGRKRLVSNIFIHHDSANRDMNSEICLMELKKPVPYEPDLYPACFHKQMRRFSGSTGYVMRTKWGFPNQAAVIATEMNYIDRCPTYRENFRIDYSSMGCIKSKGSTAVATMGECKSDDGLPVVVVEDGVVKLVGIVAWTTGNCRTDIAGYITRLDHLQTWIKGIVQSEGFWETPGEFKAANDFALPGSDGERSESLMDISQPVQCRSQIDGYGYQGPSSDDSIAKRIKTTSDFRDLANGKVDPESTTIAGILPPLSLRTASFWEQLAGKIVGSSVEPDENNWRWIVDFNGNCVGSLISSQTVLTTAICCLMQKSNYVYVGGFSTRKTGMRRTINERRVHPNFDQSKLRNDVCLVHLKQPVPFGPNIQPICLPSATDTLEKGAMLYLAGWGSTSIKGGLSKELRSAKIPVIPFAACEAQYGKLGLQLKEKSHICAMKNGGGVGPCRGDWGAPAVYLGDASNPTLFGMVSFGRGCAGNEYASVYTNIRSYVDWIDETAEALQGTTWPTQPPSTTTTTTTTTTATTTTTIPTTTTPAYLGYLTGTVNSCKPSWDDEYENTRTVGRWRTEDVITINKHDPYGLYDDVYPEWTDDYADWNEENFANFYDQQGSELDLSVTDDNGGLGRIKGGKNVDNAATWPFAIRISIEDKPVVCGAVLIGKRWALTAGHCCVSGVLNQATLHVGEQVRFVAGMVRYPSYNENNYNHNICVIKLDADVAYDDETHPVCLSDDVNTAQLEEAETYIAGFGDGNSGEQLREAVMRVVSKTECESEISSNFIKSSMFCATGFFESQNVDTCQGHAGGPHVRIVDGEPVLTGVISWGNGCVKQSRYSIYTSVAEYIDFIKFAVNQLETGSDVDYVPGITYPDKTTLQMAVTTYTCPKPLDSFVDNSYSPIPAEHAWPWLVNIHHQCFGVLVGASQVLTASSCCTGQIKGKFAFNNGRRRMIFDWRNNKDLCLIQLNTAFRISPKTYPICLNEPNHDADVLFVKSLEKSEFQMTYSDKNECADKYSKSPE